jgi:hypothetical protein
VEPADHARPDTAELFAWAFVALWSLLRVACGLARHQFFAEELAACSLLVGSCLLLRHLVAHPRHA